MSYTKRRVSASQVSPATAAAAMSKRQYEDWWVALLEDTVADFNVSMRYPEDE